MKILSQPKIAPLDKCPYLEETQASQEYFFAIEMSAEEVDILVNSGWRKFGAYIFRPSCLSCKQCSPLRILVNKFSANKKQRKLLRKSEDIVIKIEELNYKSDYYKIFCDHSINRFDQTLNEIGDEHSFKETFFVRTSPSQVFNYYLDDKLIAWGIVDQGENILSSVYFSFDTRYSKLELGKLSILKEIEYARSSNLAYYHLGYYVKGNKSMEYKASYHPHEQMDWISGDWNLQTK